MTTIQDARKAVEHLEHRTNEARNYFYETLVSEIETNGLTGYRLMHELGVSQTRAYQIIRSAQRHTRHNTK